MMTSRTTLYVAVSLVITGMVKYTEIKINAPLAAAFRSVGKPGIATIISIGALAGLTTVMMILMLGQSRVFFAMSRDRLLPSVFSKVSLRFGTPYRTSIVTGVVVAVIAIGVGLLRRSRPELPRAFRCPAVPFVPILSVLASFYLMLNLPALTWERFVIWMAIGLVIYVFYGARKSRLATAAETGYNTAEYGGEAAEIAGRQSRSGATPAG